MIPARVAEIFPGCIDVATIVKFQRLRFSGEGITSAGALNNVVFPAPTAPTIAIRFMVALNFFNSHKV